MTIVEFIDKNPILNIASSLHYNPEKVIFVGVTGEKGFQKRDAILIGEYLNSKHINDIKIIYRPIKKNNLESIIELLEDIVNTNEECAFDLTGGDDLILVAIGIVKERHKDKNIRLHQINPVNAKLIDYDNQKEIDTPEYVSSGIEEHFLLYDAVVEDIFRSNPEDTKIMEDVDFLWDLSINGIPSSDERKKQQDIFALSKWKKVTGLISDCCVKRDDGTIKNKVKIDFSKKEKDLKPKDFKDFRNLFENYIDYFIDHGYIKSKEYIKDKSNKEFLIIEIDDKEYIVHSLTNEGHVMELYIYHLIRDCEKYSDAAANVSIVWDEVIDSLDGSNDIANVQNEIDVVAMKKLKPIFISCKSGRVEVNELYKLNTVANYFGGSFSKKILIVADLNVAMGDNVYYSNSSQKSAIRIISEFRQRAKDLRINIITGAHKKDKEKLLKEILSNS